jgi:hypothetical protein
MSNIGVNLRSSAVPIDQTLRRRIRAWLVFFILALALSGLTAIPLQWELNLLASLATVHGSRCRGCGPLSAWIVQVNTGLKESTANTFLAIGTDWLAFGHIAIAISFIGPLRDPVRNRWVLEFGLIACVLVIPWALTFGALRGLPFFWQLVDCSFGIFGFIPLWLCRRDILRLEGLQTQGDCI